MDSNISGNVRKEIVKEYMNSRTSVKMIAKKHGLSIEQVIDILEKYENLYGEIPRNLNNIRDDDEINQKIYELRKKGLSYEKIVEELKEQGIKISIQTLIKRCKKIFFKRGKEERKEINQKIYELRKKGLSYEKIVEELEKQGIKMSRTTIDKKEEESQRINKAIYDLREQGLSYEAIKEALEKEGIKLSTRTITIKCKEIYMSKNKDNKKKKTVESQQLDEKIYYLRELGIPFEKIAEQLTAEGINLTTKQGVEQRYKKILKVNKQQLIKAILNLITTRRATMEQIQQIAEYYGVDLDELINSVEER